MKKIYAAYLFGMIAVALTIAINSAIKIYNILKKEEEKIEDEEGQEEDEDEEEFESFKNVKIVG